MVSYTMWFHENMLHNLTQPIILFKFFRNDIAQCLIFAIGLLNRNTFSLGGKIHASGQFVFLEY
jgi:hypothetical protein